MRDVFLKFEDHAETLAALEAAGVTVPYEEEGEARLGYRDTGLPAGMLALKPVGAACDGLVYAPTGKTVTGGDGIAYPEMAVVAGYHVNLRLADGTALPAELAAHVVAPEPATPAERFA
ncbi:hypothetical protein JET14_08745 [Martelella lutilitoris]|uniref:Uncharacterized protein n=1 Tax=Martelella lutilitoris TaxID=2583532 RepID=A0A7T7KMW3_9HYPH|nr:hypothetical protein [Martelella lutilitoris]QQM32207.1 hypothetical protein JET14_08745 [Martelella lutilitoris]